MRKSVVAAALGGAGTPVLALGVLAGVVSARPNEQSATPTPTARAGASATPNARQQQAQQRADEFLERLARNLGVTPERLRDALKQTALEEIDRAQAAGTLTPEQAARAKERINSGNLGGFGFGGPGLGRGGPAGKHGMGITSLNRDQLAQFLGITAEQLRTELQGKSLAQVAQAHGKTVDQLKAFIIQNAEQQSAQAVQAGRITQQQATQMLERLRERIDDMVNRVHQERGRPGRGR
jgi:hypothetical protein